MGKLNDMLHMMMEPTVVGIKPDGTVTPSTGSIIVHNYLEN